MNEVHEKIGALIAKADTAHTRIDKLESGIRDDLKSIAVELKELNAYMHRGKGFAAAALLVASVLGAALTKLASFIFASH